MVVELIIALLAGILAGLLTGLLPGIHINLVASFILAFMLSHPELSLPLAVFIAVLSATHVIMDFIPTTLLGVPGEESFLSVMPSHQLVMEGKAYEAIRYAFLGCMIALPVFLLLVPVYMFILPHAFTRVESLIPYALVLSSVYLILRGKNVLACLAVFILSGIIGFFAFSLPVKEPLLPLLSGLFGISSLLSGLSGKQSKVRQGMSRFRADKRKMAKPTIVASIVAPIFSFFPAIGAGHISLFSSEIVKLNPRQFIFLNGFCAALTMNLSIVAAYSIGKTRTGTAAAIDSLLESFSFLDLSALIASVIISTILVYGAAIKISRKSIEIYEKFPYAKIALLTLVFVVVTNILLTNSLGLVVLAAASALGLIVVYSSIERIQLMGSLLLPTILYYFA